MTGKEHATSRALPSVDNDVFRNATLERKVRVKDGPCWPKPVAFHCEKKRMGVLDALSPHLIMCALFPFTLGESAPNYQ